MKRLIIPASILAIALSLGLAAPAALAKNPDHWEPDQWLFFHWLTQQWLPDHKPPHHKPPYHKPPQQLPQAKFSWRMAKRTKSIYNTEFKPELDNGERHWMIKGPGGEPGLYGGVSSVPLDQINPPDGYKVVFNGCNSEGKIQQYEWRIDGKRVAKSKDCKFKTRLLQGTYQVELVVKGGGRKSSVTQQVSPRDLLIVIMGDSYSSGEGNGLKMWPDDGGIDDTNLADASANDGKGWSENAYWDYANCHRSTRSGQANAAIDLENADPHTSVTTLYLACSGAQIDSGILGIKDGYLGGPEKPQTYQAYELAIMNGRDIDAIIHGIGGNDIGFVPIVAEGLFQPDTFLSTQLSQLIPVDPKLPVTAELPPVAASALPFLLLAPDEDYVDVRPAGPPGPVFPPLKVLEPMALHACDSQFQKAAFGAGGIGPNESCRESIGTTEFGLAQVQACFTGNGPNDCEFARSYFVYSDFDATPKEGEWIHPNGDSVGVPASWPGLGVPESRIFYTEYPDLTTTFKDYPTDTSLEFCSIALNKRQMLVLLRALKQLADNPALIQVLIDWVNANVGPTDEFGLAQNEFQWASEAVLNAPLIPELKALMLDLTSTWRARTGAGLTDYTLIGGGQAVGFVNLGNDAPALNEMTALSNGVYGWNSVIGTHDLASGHGLCTPQPDGSNDAIAAFAYLIGTGTPDGTNGSGSAHPNLLGQQAYRTPLAAKLQQVLLDD
jgi:hypothetical protein